MHWSDLPLNPSRRMLRQFAGLLVLLFGGLAASHWIATRTLDTRTAIALAAAALGVVGLAAPSVMRPVFIASTVLTFPIGWVVSRVILLVLFALAITPIGLLFRMRGRDVLALRRKGERTSYWTAKPEPTDIASYFRQF